MITEDRKSVFIKTVLWIGVVADAVWAIALFVPSLFGILTGVSDFNPDAQFRQVMAIGGSLMAGWTILLIWVAGNPIERRVVILITAFPVVFGLFIVALIGFQNGNTGNIWILAKLSFLFVGLIVSFFLANPE